MSALPANDGHTDIVGKTVDLDYITEVTTSEDDSAKDNSESFSEGDVLQSGVNYKQHLNAFITP